jgi:hypothetical protein
MALAMSKDTADRWVTTSALIVIGVYAYRRFTSTSTPTQKGTAKNLLGASPLPPLGQFVTAWGFVFLVCALMAEAEPGLGGGFAVLIATGDLLTNTSAITTAVTTQEGPAATAGAPGNVFSPSGGALGGPSAVAGGLGTIGGTLGSAQQGAGAGVGSATSSGAALDQANQSVGAAVQAAGLLSGLDW